MAPLSHTPLDHGCSFRSDAVREGVVATAGKNLRILSVDTIGMGGGQEEAFNTQKIDLRYTPQHMTLLSAGMGNSVGAPESRKTIVAVVESDYNEYGLEAKIAMGFDGTGGSGAASSCGGKANDNSMDMVEGSDDEGDKKMDTEEGDGMDPEEKEARKTPSNQRPRSECPWPLGFVCSLARPIRFMQNSGLR
ncbi:Spliceosome-associated protein 130 [Seminavis robusta]|uniref:Spliceosome-associated protein 130 n=1 Tax=Seminavis robusta TaxID=568900 RepID=A0A9N8EDP7_9STRA|nr:Spliceosome-associated protein 130 [Seminavis robusta]|eukprot:Sro972_g226560.1 Spliceosome-associated protein 130 (192) ;mRNA; r:8837-9412